MKTNIEIETLSALSRDDLLFALDKLAEACHIIHFEIGAPDGGMSIRDAIREAQDEVTSKEKRRLRKILKQFFAEITRLQEEQGRREFVRSLIVSIVKSMTTAEYAENVVDYAWTALLEYEPDEVTMKTKIK